ncbi:FAE1_CUT1_RppA domain-containing protein [Cephalotus follicularis]|uniref:FAE1_CUT1_RppA domain-containing protein n=1 Tax=Cephalotus follicularis TaxID=3775 RepID=A0A1Q3D4W7_CEPFO|nr:FAE1_CUT1_RppA domain-containing protein [Cephalotus follicularis]
MRFSEKFSEASLVFMRTVSEKAGLGQSTYVPEALLRKPMNPSLEDSRREAEMVMFGAVDELLAKTGVEGKDIGIVIVNCSIFNVVPSLSAMIVNRYKLGQHTVSYNLSGMGCSAGLIAIGLAKQLLQVRHRSYALVVSTENITQNCYFGNDRSKLLSNCIFRIGGAAILLTNRPYISKVAK